MTKEDFRSECRKWLTRKDQKALFGIDRESSETNAGETAFLREWKEHSLYLKRTLADARFARRHAPERRTSDDAKEILNQATPFDMERSFEKFRWNFLEEREPDYHFDLNWLMSYLLKLSINERLAVFDKEKGWRAFNKVCEVRYE